MSKPAPGACHDCHKPIRGEGCTTVRCGRCAALHRRAKTKRPSRGGAHPGPSHSPEQQRREAWAAVEEAKRQRVPFSDPRWQRSHAEAMAEQAQKGRAA